MTVSGCLAQDLNLRYLLRFNNRRACNGDVGQWPTGGKKNGATRAPSVLLLVEVARIELASGSTPQSGLHA